MRVVSPLHVASPQLHSPEVSSTVSTPASSDKCHHRPFIVQGFHSANVSTCALSNSDTESECSTEVARINVFKDPNRFLPTTRIPPPRTSCEEVEDGAVCESKGEEEKQEQRSRGGESHKLRDTFREDASGESLESEKDSASAQQKQYQKKMEDKQKASPDKEDPSTVQQEQCQRQTKENQEASPDKEDPSTVQQEQCQRQTKENQKASSDKEETSAAQQKQYQRQTEVKQKAIVSKKKKSATRRARVCMPTISRAKRLKVEVDAGSDESSMVTQLQPPLENSSASDPKFTASPRAGRKRNWHNKSLSSDEDEDHNPSSVPLRSSMKGVKSVVLSSSAQGPEKTVEKPPLAKVSFIILCIH